MISKHVAVLLNLGHAVDHMFLLIFATAIGAIAEDFNIHRWEDLMPYGVGTYLLFGIGSLPSGRLGDLWGRRSMMVVFFFGLGASALLTSLTRTPWELAGGLTLVGLFASIYHPVGIPMLLQRSTKPGATIGLNGLIGNLGIALTAVLTGVLVKWLGWRAAFAVPGVVCIVLGMVFARICPIESEPPAARPRGTAVQLPPSLQVRVLVAMTATVITMNLLFNFSTNGNAQLMSERFRGIIEDPALLGTLLGCLYAVASPAQLVVGRLLDRMALKPLFLGVSLAQVPALLLASEAQGWCLYALLLGAMIFIFASVPFSDALLVRYVDDSVRSRIAGLRLAFALGVSSLAVWLLGPLVKGAGFGMMLLIMAGIAVCSSIAVLLLPGESARSLTAPSMRR